MLIVNTYVWLRNSVIHSAKSEVRPSKRSSSLGGHGWSCDGTKTPGPIWVNGIATGSGLILTARLLDRMGKGIRGAPRDALVAALVWLLVATVLLGTAYLLLTALLVSGLRAAGAPWPLAIAIPLVVSVGVALFGVLRAKAMLRHADFEGTRRQLKLGFGAADAEPPADAAPPEAAP